MRLTRRGFVTGAALAGAAHPGAAAQPPAARGEYGRRFTGESLREVAFPLGGLGTGTVSLGGYGQFRDWEIFNRPHKGGVLPFTFAALRLSGSGLKRTRVRVLERQMLPPYPGGHGVPREAALGLPRFREVVFTGAYPFAHLRFRDAGLPAEVALEAVNPMIPLATGDSSLPVAVLRYLVTSRATSPLDATIAFSLMNPVGYDGVTKLRGRQEKFFGRNRNTYRAEGSAAGLFLDSAKYAADSARFGSMALLTRAGDLSYRLAWEHGAWWDEFQKWWDEFAGAGRFPGTAAPESADGTTEYATLAVHFSLAPGETKDAVFVLGWHFPHGENYWSREPEHQGKILRNEYGQRWKSAWEPAAYTLTNLEGLRRRSLGYRDALWSSTLPAAVVDAVSSQASIARTNTVMVLEGGKTLAFEGCNDNSGCCPMNCTHVYNYEQSMAFLYPDLERSMREIDFLTNMRPDGSMSFRTPVPLRPGGNQNFPAADGQMGCVMKVYREWMLGAGDAWLRRLWPEVKRALEFAWVKWDVDRDGLMEGEQHNTYDIEFYGPNSMMGTLYLGALAAAERMAAHLGETETARRYRDMREAGARRLDETLWNGEFYPQRTDLRAEKAAKYQYGDGCLSDQLLGQWFAEVVGLGKLLPAEHVRTALESIFRYNFRQDFFDFPNTQRLYALNDEKGLLLCSWPRGGRPAIPFPYSDEVWTGIEYQVAAHLMYEGMVKEGLAIVDAARDRYNGVRRNPWNEVECGHHYARAMSSWSLLTALSGFTWSAPDRALRFRPRVPGPLFRVLFSTGQAWGVYTQRKEAAQLAVELAVEGGTFELAALRAPAAGRRLRVRGVSGTRVEAQGGEAVIRFDPPAHLEPGGRLALAILAD